MLTNLYIVGGKGLEFQGGKKVGFFLLRNSSLHAFNRKEEESDCSKEILSWQQAQGAYVCVCVCVCVFVCVCVCVCVCSA